MFEKLLSNLPYNPGLTHQLAFYAKRMRGEAAIRRLGVIFITAALVIQFLAVLSPSQPTLASSDNDLITGGIGSKSQAVTACSNNVRSYGSILNNYGISCNDVANGSVVSLNSTSYNNQLFSMGWNPQGSHNVNTGKPTSETPVNIPGAPSPVYWRYLWSWDSYASSSYTAVQIRSSITGRTYFILFNCGNLVSIGIPPAYSPPKDYCTNKPGIQASWAECDVCPNKTGLQMSPNDCDVCSNLPGIQTTAAECDVCPNIGGVQTNTTQCDLCPNKVGVQNSVAQCDVCPNINGIQTSAAECDVCPLKAGIQTTADACDVCSNVAGVQTSPDECDVCSSIPGIQTDISQCKSCNTSVNSQDTLACVQRHKTASNTTQSITDANSTTAQPGDVIVYTIYAANAGKATVKAFVFQENMSDVLDYADIIDLHGGAIDNISKVVSWPAADIKSGATLSRQITIKVKMQIPQTPASSSDPTHFDMIMTNVYGNTINIKLPSTVITTVASVTTTTLPNTGPGASLFISFIAVLVAGYFFARSRLLAKEAVIAIHVNREGAL
jgi:uncharacterized repeat protein (TIGR01451 family)